MAAAVLVATLLAFATHIYAYEVILYSLLAGLTGGVCAALWTDRLSIQNGLVIVATGVLLGVLIYGFYWLFSWLLATSGAGVPFFDYVWQRAETTALARRGKVLFTIGPGLFAVICVVEVLIVTLTSAYIARLLHPMFGKY